MRIAVCDDELQCRRQLSQYRSGIELALEVDQSYIMDILRSPESFFAGWKLYKVTAAFAEPFESGRRISRQIPAHSRRKNHQALHLC